MKNNFLLILIFLFVNLTNNILANDFTFDVEKIDITNNGNTINGFKGIANSIDGALKIKADKFIYNQNLSTLNAIGNVLVNDIVNNIEIEADQLMYNENLSILDATGDVLVKDFNENKEIKANQLIYDKNLSTFDAIGNVLIEDLINNFFLKSQKIFYDIKNQQISSNSKTQFKDILGNVILSKDFIFKNNENLIKFNNLELIDSQKNIINLDMAFMNVTSKKLIGKDISFEFKDQGFNKDNQPRLKGNAVSSDQDSTIINKGVFTSCKKSDDCPPWELSAEKITHNKKNKTISYKNAWLKIYDKPVFYFPKFFHPDPTVKRQSGLLMPLFQNSTSLGSSFHLPYYLVISDNKDLTLKPRFYNNNKLLLQSEYRQVGLNSNYHLDASFIAQNKKSTKSHYFLNTSKGLNAAYFDETVLDLRLEQVSDDGYLKTYDIKSPIIKNNNSLKSSIGFNGYKEDLSLTVDLEVYETLSKEDSDRYEYVLPTYSLTKQFQEDESLNGVYTLSSSGFIKNYNTNIYEKVLINDVNFNSYSKFTDIGLKNNYNFLFKNVNTDGDNSSNYKSSLDNTLGAIFEYNTSYPLKKETINYKDTFKPIASFRYSPNKTKDIKNTERRIEINNVYNLNRLSLNDTVEGGASITYGAEFSKENKINQEVFNFKIANIFRVDEEKNLPTNSSLGKKTSDIFGSFDIKPNEIFSLGYNFAQKNNLKDTNYETLKTEINLNKFVTTFEYLNENNTIGNESFLDNKTSYTMSESNSISFGTRENKKTEATEFYNLIYQYRNDCLIAALEYNKDYYSDKGLKPSENIFLKLTIVPFGQTSSPNLNK